jgi:hypothetical protein
MTKIIDIKKSVGFLFIIPVFFLNLACNTSSNQHELKLIVFEIQGGWGYKINIDKKTIIYQPYIPVVAGNKPFHSKSDALKVGEKVTGKIRKGEIPMVTKEDLKECGISVEP